MRFSLLLSTTPEDRNRNTKTLVDLISSNFFSFVTNAAHHFFRNFYGKTDFPLNYFIHFSKIGKCTYHVSRKYWKYFKKVIHWCTWRHNGILIFNHKVEKFRRLFFKKIIWYFKNNHIMQNFIQKVTKYPQNLTSQSLRLWNFAWRCFTSYLILILTLTISDLPTTEIIRKCIIYCSTGSFPTTNNKWVQHASAARSAYKNSS